MIFQHAVGMMYKTGKLEITSDVRSKPLEQKRKRGRPAKLPLCLERSPPNRDTIARDNTEVVVSEDVVQVELSPEPPTAVYQPPSIPSTVHPFPSTPVYLPPSILLPAPVGKKGRARRKILPATSEAPVRMSTRNKKSSNDPPLAPAKRKGNFREEQLRTKRTKLIDEDYQPELTKSRVTTRSRKNKK